MATCLSADDLTVAFNDIKNLFNEVLNETKTQAQAQVEINSAIDALTDLEFNGGNYTPRIVRLFPGGDNMVNFQLRYIACAKGSTTIPDENDSWAINLTLTQDPADDTKSIVLHPNTSELLVDQRIAINDGVRSGISVARSLPLPEEVCEEVVVLYADSCSSSSSCSGDGKRKKRKKRKKGKCGRRSGCNKSSSSSSSSCSDVCIHIVDEDDHHSSHGGFYEYKKFLAELNGGQEVPPNPSPAYGTGKVVFNIQAKSLKYTVKVCDLSSPLFSIGGSPGHFHQGGVGENGPVVKNLDPFVFDAKKNCYVSNGYWSSTDTQPLTDELIEALCNGGLYFNIHTERVQTGEVRGQIFLVLDESVRCEKASKCKKSRSKSCSSSSSSSSSEQEEDCYYAYYDGESYHQCLSYWYEGEYCECRDSRDYNMDYDYYYHDGQDHYRANRYYNGSDYCECDGRYEKSSRRSPRPSSRRSSSDLTYYYYDGRRYRQCQYYYSNDEKIPCNGDYDQQADYYYRHGDSYDTCNSYKLSGSSKYYKCDGYRRNKGKEGNKGSKKKRRSKKDKCCAKSDRYEDQREGESYEDYCKRFYGN